MSDVPLTDLGTEPFNHTSNALPTELPWLNDFELLHILLSFLVDENVEFWYIAVMDINVNPGI